MNAFVVEVATKHPLLLGSLAVPVILFILSSLLAPTFNYKGKHVMITGGSSGIGLEVKKVMFIKSQ